MARFRAVIQGSHGKASRLGGATTGITGHINGWNVGVTVHGQVNDNGDDVFKVYATGGSNDRGADRLIAIVTRRNGSIRVEAA
jgi:hypothetical protein